MNFLYFIIGILVGVLMAVLNMFLYKREVQNRIKKFTSRKATIVETTNPIDDIDLTN